MRTKKIIAGVCASLMLAASAIPTVTAAESVKVTVGNTTAAPGETFSVKMELSDIPSAGINACDFGIKYDSSVLTITDVALGDLAKGDDTSVEGMPDPWTYNIEENLVCVTYGVGTTNTDFYMTGSGTFLTISGTVSETAAAGTKSNLDVVAVDRLIKPSSSSVNDEIIFGVYGKDEEAPVVYDPTITNGYVEVTGGETNESTEATGETGNTGESIDFGEVSLLGDVDVDGRVNSTDIVILNQYLISITEYPLKSSTAYANADCDGNKELNSKDSMAIINHTLGAALLS